MGNTLRHSIFALLICVCAVSCGPKQRDYSSLHPYVAAVATDTSLSAHTVMSSFRVERSSGAVYVIGRSKDCFSVATALIGADYFDNIDARHSPDHLADFAGETIAVVDDKAGCLEQDSTATDVKYRENCLKAVVMTLDSLCYANPYTSDKEAAKLPCKLLIAASPEFGTSRADIDTLLSIFNVGLKVIYAASELTDFAAARHPGSANFALSASRPSLYMSPKNGITLTDSLRSSLTEMLDTYNQRGDDAAPLDALLVEDDSLLARYKEELADLLEGEGLDYETYRSLLSPGFEIITRNQAVSCAAYAALRSTDLFTHRAAAPELMVYRIVDELVYPDQSDWRMVTYNEKH